MLLRNVSVNTCHTHKLLQSALVIYSAAYVSDNTVKIPVHQAEAVFNNNITLVIDIVCQSQCDTQAGLRLLFTANLLVSHSVSSIIKLSEFLFRGKREEGEKQTAVCCHRNSVR